MSENVCLLHGNAAIKHFQAAIFSLSTNRLCRGLHISPKLQRAQAYPRTVGLDLIPCQISSEGFKITEKSMQGFQ